VYKTEVIKCNLNPTWRPFALPVRTLCNGDLDRFAIDFVMKFFYLVEIIFASLLPHNVFDNAWVLG
jgi:hypothetical protein